MFFYHKLGRFVPALLGIILAEHWSPLLQAESLIIIKDPLEHHYPERIWNQGPFLAREVACKPKGEAAELPVLSEPLHGSSRVSLFVFLRFREMPVLTCDTIH